LAWTDKIEDNGIYDYFLFAATVFLLRQVVERRTALAFSENVLLITLWQCGLASWGNVWISWIHSTALLGASYS